LHVGGESNRLYGMVGGEKKRERSYTSEGSQEKGKARGRSPKDRESLIAVRNSKNKMKEHNKGKRKKERRSRLNLTTPVLKKSKGVHLG